ncbi:MAG: hypothetical protein EBU04_05410 [Verrucomicrobia bacterium]|nr:hypothetical protein [Verrucomicrobiota bacterium]
MRFLRLICLCGLAATLGAAETNTVKTETQTPETPAPPVPRSLLKLKIAPGASLKFDFPELSADRYGKYAACNVTLPLGYKAARPYPLVAWLAGADGGNTPNRSFLPTGDFILVGLPYPQGANNPKQANMVGDFSRIWTYHRTMLDEIAHFIPNIDRSRSILAGFSNGAHAIDGMFRVSGNKPPLTDYFGVFILADGGGTDYTSIGILPDLTGKHVYACWGEKSPNRRTSAKLAREMKSFGADTAADEIKGSGHAFPETEFPKIAAWLEKTGPTAPAAGAKK